ncbi:uncharacterized protein CELE_F59B10.3 [Caenorhabditis elegans]|uniref:Uncharacterized protein F59B10.3 n=1 Tax=Caenorhabditis elegans TaxID=6239 RepID=YSR3_CAEEL|nr:Uncharacterized protein CELE_F59B10.3 [Caenorhabditis elegans]Q09951.2 RecName: Full=Uncharacterized protein F59B10.3 [Caenorhabditis elegans]CAA88597.2 Uncharacterized protein CELE_F59B10.3 [Caenorhabditis elegans]|eukprot:NP_496264.2 Uncharacterized protein CELE_F59B10.3 [Caenorhabditis elegans]
MSNSRWDGYQQATQAPGLNRQFDTQTNVLAADSFVRSGLVGQQVNTIDPSFYDCIYGVANSANTVIERCYKDIGCCADGCCKNGYWHNRYGWAVALIVIFCILVIVAFVIWLVVWLFNRSKDKQQKRELYEHYEENNYSGLPTPQPTPTHYPAEQYSYDPARDRDNYRY